MTAHLPPWFPPLCAFLACIVSGITSFGDGVCFLLLVSLASAAGIIPNDEDTYPTAVLYVTLLPLASLPALLWAGRKELKRSAGYASLLSISTAALIPLGSKLLLSGSLQVIKTVIGCFFVCFACFSLWVAMYGLGKDRIAAGKPLPACLLCLVRAVSCGRCGAAGASQTLGAPLLADSEAPDPAAEATTDSGDGLVTASPVRSAAVAGASSSVNFVASATGDGPDDKPSVRGFWKSVVSSASLISVLDGVDIALIASAAADGRRDSSASAASRLVSVLEPSDFSVPGADTARTTSFSALSSGAAAMPLTETVTVVGAATGDVAAAQPPSDNEGPQTCTKRAGRCLFPEASDRCSPLAIGIVLFFTGFASGLMAGLVGSGGPPQLVAFAQLRLKKEWIRGVKLIATTVSNLIRITLFAVWGSDIFREAWYVYLAVALASFAGATIGSYLRQWVAGETILRLLYVLLFLSTGELFGALEDPVGISAFAVATAAWLASVGFIYLYPKPIGVVCGGARHAVTCGRC